MRDRPAKTRPRATPVAACAVRGPCRCRAGSATPANPAGSPASLGADGNTARVWSRSSPAAARPGPRPARALSGTGALCEVSARGFARREGWQRLGVARSPCGDPRAGSLPGLALAAGTRPVARVRALGVRPPATAGRPASGRRGRSGHGLRPSPLAPCEGPADAVRGPLRRPTLRVHRLRSGPMGSACRAGVVNQSSAPGCAGRRGCSQRPAAVGWLGAPGPPSSRPPPKGAPATTLRLVARLPRCGCGVRGAGGWPCGSRCHRAWLAHVLASSCYWAGHGPCGAVSSRGHPVWACSHGHTPSPDPGRLPCGAGLSCCALSRLRRLAPDGLQSLTPSRRWRCALRLPPGGRLSPSPAALRLAPPGLAGQGCGPDRQGSPRPSSSA